MYMYMYICMHLLYTVHRISVREWGSPGFYHPHHRLSFSLPGDLEAHIEIMLNYGKLPQACLPLLGKVGIFNPVSVPVGVHCMCMGRPNLIMHTLFVFWLLK